MRLILADEWRERVAPYHFPSYFSLPLRMMYDSWQDPSDPLGSLLEVFKWARIVAAHDVFPSVFVAQVALESGFGKSQDSLLGVKATKQDILDGTYKKMRTKEVFRDKDIQALGDDLVSIDHVYSDGSKLVTCYQLFHFQPGLEDDFEKFLRVYELHYTKYHKERPNPRWGPEDFILNVTQAHPPYATDKEYADKLLAIIKTRDLHSLDTEFAVNWWANKLKERKHEQE